MSLPTVDNVVRGNASPEAAQRRLMHAHDQKLLASSDNPYWRTPQAGFDLLLKEFPIAIDLAADSLDTLCEQWLGPGSPVMGLNRIGLIVGEQRCEDALAFEHWAEVIPEYSYGFLNPPYSRKRKMPIEPWIRRCWLTALEGRGVIAWLPAAIQTQWWQEFVWNGSYEDREPWHSADEIRFFPHRVSFDPPPGVEASGNANVNSAIVIWEPPRPYVGPWVPTVRYWSYR